MSNNADREAAARAELVEMFGEEVASHLDMLEAYTQGIGRIMRAIEKCDTVNDRAYGVFAMAELKAVANEMRIEFKPLSSMMIDEDDD